MAISIILLMLFLPLAALAEAPDQDPVLDNSGDTNNDSDSDSGTTGGGDVGGISGGSDESSAPPLPDSSPGSDQESEKLSGSGDDGSENSGTADQLDGNSDGEENETGDENVLGSDSEEDNVMAPGPEDDNKISEKNNTYVATVEVKGNIDPDEVPGLDEELDFKVQFTEIGKVSTIGSLRIESPSGFVLTESSLEWKFYDYLSSTEYAADAGWKNWSGEMEKDAGDNLTGFISLWANSINDYLSYGQSIITEFKATSPADIDSSDYYVDGEGNTFDGKLYTVETDVWTYAVNSGGTPISAGEAGAGTGYAYQNKGNNTRSEDYSQRTFFVADKKFSIAVPGETYDLQASYKPPSGVSNTKYNVASYQISGNGDGTFTYSFDLEVYDQHGNRLNSDSVLVSLYSNEPVWSGNNVSVSGQIDSTKTAYYDSDRNLNTVNFIGAEYTTIYIIVEWTAGGNNQSMGTKDNSSWTLDTGRPAVTSQGLSIPVIEANFAGILTVAAQNAQKTYDGNVYGPFNYNITGFQDGDSESSHFAGQSLTFGDADTAVNAGAYAISPTGYSSIKYIIDFVDAVLTINKADLEVTAVAGNITYGDAPPTVSLLYSGFVNGEDKTVLDNTGFAMGTDYTQYADVGTYNTTIEIGSATDNNYNYIPLKSSTFEVLKKALTIAANNQDKVFGNLFTFAGTEFTADGLVNNDMIGSVVLASAGEPTDAIVGDHDITITGAQGAKLHNYSITYQNGILTVAAGGGQGGGDDDAGGTGGGGTGGDGGDDDTVVLGGGLDFPFLPLAGPPAVEPAPVLLAAVPPATPVAAEEAAGEDLVVAPEEAQVELLPEEPQVEPLETGLPWWPLLLLIPGFIWFLWARLVLIRIPDQENEDKYKTVARKIARRKDKRWYVDIEKQLDQHLMHSGEVMVDFRGGLIKEAKKAVYSGETALSTGELRYALINRSRLITWVEDLDQKVSQQAG